MQLSENTYPWYKDIFYHRSGCILLVLKQHSVTFVPPLPNIAPSWLISALHVKTFGDPCEYWKRLHWEIYIWNTDIEESTLRMAGAFEIARYPLHSSTNRGWSSFKMTLKHLNNTKPMFQGRETTTNSTHEIYFPVENRRHMYNRQRSTAVRHRWYVLLHVASRAENSLGFSPTALLNVSNLEKASPVTRPGVKEESCSPKMSVK